MFFDFCHNLPKKQNELKNYTKICICCWQILDHKKFAAKVQIFFPKSFKNAIRHCV